MSAFEELKPYDSAMSLKPYDSPMSPKGYVLDGVEVRPVGEISRACALTPERHPSSRTEVDEFPVVPVALDVEGQKIMQERPPLSLTMPKGLQPYVAEACGIATMIIIGLITNM